MLTDALLPHLRNHLQTIPLKAHAAVMIRTIPAVERKMIVTSG
jgi:hypothetical protein